MTGATEPGLAEAFGELRDLIRADGGDMVLVSAECGTVEIDLVLESAACADCVMPRPYLERVARDIFASYGQQPTSLTVNDPRESSDPSRQPPGG